MTGGCVLCAPIAPSRRQVMVQVENALREKKGRQEVSVAMSSSSHPPTPLPSTVHHRFPSDVSPVVPGTPHRLHYPRLGSRTTCFIPFSGKSTTRFRPAFPAVACFWSHCLLSCTARALLLLLLTHCRHRRSITSIIAAVAVGSSSRHDARLRLLISLDVLVPIRREVSRPQQLRQTGHNHTKPPPPSRRSDVINAWSFPPACTGTTSSHLYHSSI